MGLRPLVYTWSHPGTSTRSSGHRLRARWHSGAALQTVVPGSGWWTHPRSLRDQLPEVARAVAAPEPASPPRLGGKHPRGGRSPGRSPSEGWGSALTAPPTHTHTHARARASAASLLTSELTAVTQILPLQVLPCWGLGVAGAMSAWSCCVCGPHTPKAPPSAPCSPRAGHLKPVQGPQTPEPPLVPADHTGIELTLVGALGQGRGIALGRHPARPHQQ